MAGLCRLRTRATAPVRARAAPARDHDAATAPAERDVVLRPFKARVSAKIAEASVRPRCNPTPNGRNRLARTGAPSRLWHPSTSRSNARFPPLPILNGRCDARTHRQHRILPPPAAARFDAAPFPHTLGCAEQPTTPPHSVKAPCRPITLNGTHSRSPPPALDVGHPPAQ